MYHVYLYVGITLEGTFTLSVVYLRLLFQLCMSHVSTQPAALFLSPSFFFFFSYGCVKYELVYFKYPGCISFHFSFLCAHSSLTFCWSYFANCEFGFTSTKVCQHGKKSCTAFSIKNASLWDFLSWCQAAVAATLQAQCFERKNAAESVKKWENCFVRFLKCFRPALVSGKTLECMKCNIVFWHSAQCFLTIYGF